MTNLQLPKLGDPIFQNYPTPLPEDVSETIKLAVEDHLQTQIESIKDYDPEEDEEAAYLLTVSTVFRIQQLLAVSFWSDFDEANYWESKAEVIWAWTFGEG